MLVTAVILSAVVPTLIAQRWFQPTLKAIEEQDEAAALGAQAAVAPVPVRDR